MGVGDRWIKLGDKEPEDHVIHNKCFASIYRYSSLEMEITVLVTLTTLIIRAEANSGLIVTKIDNKGGWPRAPSVSRRAAV